jgi:hypothetical protein
VGEKYFGDTLRELAGIGVVRIEDGQVRLPDDVARAREPGGMRDLIRVRAMAAERGSDLWEKDDQGALVLLGARDLVRALAWLLSLNVLAGPFTYAKGNAPLSELQVDHTGDRLIHNDERWRPFVRWARYLGFTRDISLYSGTGTAEAGLLPDPTDAIHAVLSQCIPVDDWVPLSSAILVLATELPVVDGGIYRRAVIDRGAPEYDADCSPSLTLALERLRARGDIDLEVGAGDAEKLVFANNRGAFHALRLTRTTR